MGCEAAKELAKEPPLYYLRPLECQTIQGSGNTLQGKNVHHVLAINHKAQGRQEALQSEFAKRVPLEDV